jgi:hypothetical protein
LAELVIPQAAGLVVQGCTTNILVLMLALPCLMRAALSFQLFHVKCALHSRSILYFIRCKQSLEEKLRQHKVRPPWHNRKASNALPYGNIGPFKKPEIQLHSQ